jgi:hypothetical protein
MKPFLIGRYQLGWRMVNLYGVPKLAGANFNLCRDRDDSFIECGLDCRDPAEALGWLCHEAWEMTMEDMVCCYRPKSFNENASDTYHFFFDHNQHTEICSRASFFLWQCWDDFKRAHRKAHRKARKSH